MNALKRLTMMASLLTGILLTLSLSYGSQAATAVSHHSAAPLKLSSTTSQEPCPIRVGRGRPKRLCADR
ncbi:MAG: hypothetical protein IPL28_20625 [Chloroflexi bacterium]|nr:hypothetical protein [Chloroflexota bacterium]